MSFKYCCDNPNSIPYVILHDSSFTSNEKELLFKCLWNLPELPSYQANHNTIFSDPLYDDFLMDLLKKCLNLTDDDLKIVNGGTPPVIPIADAQYYENAICTNCGKLIYHQRATKTKIEELFNHLRNSIAHGCFNIVNSTFIGFDHPKYGGVNYTAVLKIPLNRLLEALELFQDKSQLCDLLATILKKRGYEVSDNIVNSTLYATKGEKAFFFVIKKFTGRYIDKDVIREFIEQYISHDKTQCRYVLIVDSSYSTKVVRMYLKDLNISIIDKKAMKYLLSGENVLEDLD